MILASALQNVPCATEYGGDSRLFYRAPPLPTKRATEEHARAMPDSEGFFIEGDAQKFEMRFRFEGYNFQIENDIPDGIVYFAVDDKECPDEVLLRVLRHFEKKLGKHAPSGSGPTIRVSGGAKSSVPGVRVTEVVYHDENSKNAAKGTSVNGLITAAVTALVIGATVWFKFAAVQGNLNGNQVPAAPWFQPPVR